MPTASIRVIDIPEHCGNAPRKVVLRDFLISVYERDTASALARLHQDIDWRLIGQRQLTGHRDIATWLETQPIAQALQLHTVITHGTECGADGVVTYTDGSQVAFSHVLSFAGHAKSAKINAIRSYLVPCQLAIEAPE